MVSTKTLVVYLTVVLAVLLCSLDLSKANQQSCRHRAMNYVTTQCSDFGGRKKRDLPKVITNSGEGRRNSQYRIPVHRQHESDFLGAYDGMTDYRNLDIPPGAISGGHRGHQSQSAGRFGGTPHAHSEAFASGRPEYFASAPSPSNFQPKPRFNKGFLPQASGDDLGFDLTADEVNELVDEISNKIARHLGVSSEKIKRDVLQAAMKCCQDETSCKEMCHIGVF